MSENQNVDLFTVNHEEATGGDFAPITPGEYEFVVSEVKIEKTGPNSKAPGTDMLSLKLTIRDDVDQKFKKRVVFDRIVFMSSLAWKIQQVYKAFGLDNGVKLRGVEDVAKHLQYQSVRAKVKNTNYTKNDGTPGTRDEVNFYTKSHSPRGAAAPAAADPFAAAPTGVGAGASINDADLPF